MAPDNLLSTLEQTLRQTRAVRARLVSRLSEIESESGALRSELRELDLLTSQTESAIYRLLSGSKPSRQVEYRGDLESDFDSMSDPQSSNVVGHPAARVRDDIEQRTDRFVDRTIPQATAMLLREEGGPLHVNEIYHRLREGGFNFTGHNPTISIAVSLNRNGRFRKVAPGTFDLVMRDAAQAS